MPTAEAQFDFDRIDRRTEKVTPALIGAIRDRIVNHIHPEKIILFGSQATGTATEDSDIDLLLVIRNDHRLAAMKRRDRFGKLQELFRYRLFSLDAFVLTEIEIKKRQDENEGEWDLILEIFDTGKLLYERAKEKQNQRAYSPAHQRMVSQGRA